MTDYKKITKEEKTFIKAFVKFQQSKIEISTNDINWMENDIRNIIGNSNGEHRQNVEDFLNTIITM